MIDWVSIVRHSRRRFSNYVGTRAPIRMKKRRRTPPSVPATANSPQEDRLQYTCCCTHVSWSFALFYFSNFIQCCACIWLEYKMMMPSSEMSISNENANKKTFPIYLILAKNILNMNFDWEIIFSVTQFSIHIRIWLKMEEKIVFHSMNILYNIKKKSINLCSQNQRFKIENEKPMQKSESAANNITSAPKKGESPLKPLVSFLSY